MNTAASPSRWAVDRSKWHRALRLALLYVLVCVIWGTTWIAIKTAVTTVPPLTAAGLRFLLAFPVLALIVVLRRNTHFAYPRDKRPLLVLVTAGYFVAPYALINWGEQFITSGLAAIIFASVSILIPALSVPLLRTRVSAHQWVGIGLGLAGLVLLILERGGAIGIQNALGAVAVLAAAAMHALAYVLIKRHGSDVNAITLNTLPIGMAGVLLTSAGVLAEGPQASDFTPAALAALVYLAIVASVICFLVYFYLLKRMSPVPLGYVFILFPVLAQVISIRAGEQLLSPRAWLLVAFVLTAFALTQAPRRRKAEAGSLAPDGILQPRAVHGATGGASSRTAERAGGLEVAAPLLSPSVVRQILDHAELAYPREACGLAFDQAIHRCRNVADELHTSDPARYPRGAEMGYAMGFDDLMILNKSLEGPDRVRAIYHSHPDAGAYFSDEDRRLAVIDGRPAYPVDQLVVEVRQGRSHGAVLFRFDQAVHDFVSVAGFDRQGRVLGATTGGSV